MSDATPAPLTAPSLEAYRPATNDAGGPSLHPIGIVDGVDGEPATPAGWRDLEAFIRLEPELVEGLEGLGAYSHAIVVYWLHQARGVRVLHGNPGDESGVTGIFACRCPFRPNALGITVVEILEVRRDGIWVRGLDALEGSPVLDVKPYVPSRDAVPTAKAPSCVHGHRPPPTPNHASRA